MEQENKTDKHQQVPLEYKGKIVMIDVFLQELLPLLWKNDIDTIMCCEDNVPKGYIWIQLPNYEHVERFLTLLGREIVGLNINKNRWNIKPHFNYSIPDHCKKAYKLTRFSVRFPRGDLHLIVNKLKNI